MQWLREISSGDPVDWATDVTTDTAGNVIVVGATQGALPGQTQVGFQDTFLRKYDAAGNEVWTRQYGAGDGFFFFGPSLATDAVGNIYVAGDTPEDAYVRKYDPAGTFQWVAEFGSPRTEITSAVVADSAGNVFVTGHTFGAFPGQTYGGNGLSDAFVVKLDGSGTTLWTRQYGGTDWDDPFGAGVDSAGNFYTALSHSTGGELISYTTAGTLRWRRSFGGPMGNVSDLAVAGTYVYVLSTTRNAIDVLEFDQPILFRFTTGGTMVWTKKFDVGLGVVGGARARSVATDVTGEAYVTGDLFNPAPGGDAYAIRFHPDATEVWRALIDSDRNFQMAGLALGPGGILAISGALDGDLGDQSSPPSGDAFAATLSQDPTCSDTANPTGEEDGLASRLIHFYVEPGVSDLSGTVHEINCTLIVPLGL
jgi:hypothetical protein